MPDVFELEIPVQLEAGESTRNIRFDPDARGNGPVRILADGEQVATLPCPEPESPYQEIAFELDGQALLAVAHLSDTSARDGPTLVYDLYANGRSFSDGRLLSDARRPVTPAATYPERFQFIDTLLRVLVAGSALGMILALAWRADQLGWPMVFGLLALMLGAVGLATAIGRRIWARVRADEARSVAHRTALGCAVLLAGYAVASAVVLTFAGLVGTLGR